jgi:hypothetical protein
MFIAQVQPVGGYGVTTAQRPTCALCVGREGSGTQMAY